jgi:SnoaL-like domain
LKIRTPRILVTPLFLAAPASLPVADSMQDITDRMLIRELMDRYGIVHDSGSPEDYADLFTADGEIAVAPGGRCGCHARTRPGSFASGRSIT